MDDNYDGPNNILEIPNLPQILDNKSLTSPNLSIKNNIHTNIKLDQANNKNQKQKIKCVLCNRDYSSIKSLKAHLKRHTTAFRPKCDVCLKTFVCKSDYNSHKLSHPSEKDYVCLKCDKRFHFKREYDIHIVIENKNILNCYDCEKPFNDTDSLKKHVLEIHKPKNIAFQCDVCGKTFDRYPSWKCHLRAVHLGICKICEICGKKLTSSFSLRDHMLLHKGVKPISCEHCGRNFTKRSTLMVHLRTHSGIRPFKCEICEKKFTQSSSLKIHMRNHTGEKPYGCTLCDEKFVSRSILNAHHKTKHKLI